MTVQIDPALRERCYGGFEGMLYAEIGERFPDAHAAWQARELDARFPPGAHVAETLREFSQRAVAAVARLAAENHRRLVLVTHGGVLEAVYRHVKGIGYEQARDFEIRNASINRFAWDGAALRLLQWGDTEHLRDAELAAIDEIDR
jgi:probable phosphoglycerate mutase